MLPRLTSRYPRTSARKCGRRGGCTVRTDLPHPFHSHHESPSNRRRFVRLTLTPRQWRFKCESADPTSDTDLRAGYDDQRRLLRQALPASVHLSPHQLLLALESNFGCTQKKDETFSQFMSIKLKIISTRHRSSEPRILQIRRKSCILSRIPCCASPSPTSRCH